jgi:archaemetzincin
MSIRNGRLLGIGCLALGVALFGRAALLRMVEDGDADALGAESNAPDDSPDLQAIREAGHKIRPIHANKTPTQPGEWLDKHPEFGQTFDAYRAEGPNRPTERRTTLYIQPLGTFRPAEDRLLEATADLLGRFYSVPVKTLTPIGLDAIPARARRINENSGEPQILSTFVLDLLAKRRPKDAVAVLALTSSDLWPGEGWNFVFGQASLSERVGVWSLHRQGDPDAEFTTCLRRTLKTAAHETGHMFGLRHCTFFECGMNGSNHRSEADSRPLWFCPEDEMKVWWACRVDRKRRYEQLSEFAEGHGLDAEAAFWRSSRAALLSR